jgi:hypothetical protein
LPPNGRIRKLMLFQVKSMSNLQKERLNYGRKLDTPCPEDYPKDIEIVEYAPPIIKKYPKNSLILLTFSIILFFLQIFFIEYQSLFLS